jgi:hypothetical protein
MLIIMVDKSTAPTFSYHIGVVSVYFPGQKLILLTLALIIRIIMAVFRNWATKVLATLLES